MVKTPAFPFVAPYPVLQGDIIRLGSLSSEAIALSLRVWIQDIDGVIRGPFTGKASHTSSTDRSLTEGDLRVGFPGHVVQAAVSAAAQPSQRGVCYVIASIRRGVNIEALVRGYIYGPRGSLYLGDDEDSVGGQGAMRLLTVADDVAGDVTSTLAINASNARRIWKGAAIYYHASGDTASRAPNMVIDSALAGVFGALPTGFTLGSATQGRIFRQAGPTLTANEEGIMFYGENHPGFVALADNTNPTYKDNSTDPVPFPMTVTEEMDIWMKVEIGSGHANDRYSAYALVEEWIES